MPLDSDAAAIAKSAAALRAVDFVEDGMRVGLGSGSTAERMIAHLGERVAREGLSVTAVATSRRSADLTARAGIPVADFDTLTELDLTIDGADEIDPDLDMIKGGGGALLYEKIVASASQRMVAVVDPSKEVARLGAFALPVEVVAFGCPATGAQILDALRGLGLDGRAMALRTAGGAPFVTDAGHYVLDLPLGAVDDAQRLSEALTQVPGVVETGLFAGLCDLAVVGDGAGNTRLRAPGATRNLFVE